VEWIEKLKDSLNVRSWVRGKRGGERGERREGEGEGEGEGERGREKKSGRGKKEIRIKEVLLNRPLSPRTHPILSK